MLSLQPQGTVAMPSSQEGLNELAVLMDLRLAFGPGTRLWSQRSREEICYDWLRFKAQRLEASFRDFALVLYYAEKKQSPPVASLREIRKRVAIVLRALRERNRVSILSSASTPPAAPGQVDKARALKS